MRLPVEGFDDADAVGLGGPAHVHDGRVEPVEDRSPEDCDSRSLWIECFMSQVFFIQYFYELRDSDSERINDICSPPPPPKFMFCLRKLP